VGVKPVQSPTRIDQGVLDMMRRWGASAEDLALAEQVRNLREGVPGDVCEVWPENWEHWRFFLGVSSQWVYAGMAGARVALNWPGIEVVARALGLRGKAWREQVLALQVVEAEALKAWSEQAE
jgi:hypothetical protein